MPPIGDVLLAVGIGIGGAAALAALFGLAARFADRRAHRDFRRRIRDLAADQPSRPSNQP